jgi:hypothetical protein
MSTLKFLFRAFLDLIAAIFIGAVLGLFAGNGIFNAWNSGMFVVWNSFDSPMKFTQIIDATPYEVLAESMY